MTPHITRGLSSKRLASAACAAVLIAAGSALLPLFAQQPARPLALEPTALQNSACLAFGAVESSRHRATGAMRFIGTDTGAALAHPLRQGAETSPETAARGYLSVCGSLFGVADERSEMALERVTNGDDRRSSVRFQQMHSGIPVFGGEMIVQLDANRNIVSSAGRVLPQPRVATQPTVTPAQASSTALAFVVRAHHITAQELSVTTPRLWVYSQTLLGHGSRESTLVWRMDVTANDLRPIRELVLVDAVRGSIALQFNQIESALQRETYTANNTVSLPGTLVCNESNPTCAGGDTHAVGAHLGAADTYNFYLTRHGRDGIDGSGSIIRSTVHYNEDPPNALFNAFWSGTQMVYGDGVGFPLADDVVAHELTHGVTQYTSGLFYYYQSGAISESFSDIWGEFVDQTNGRGNDASGVRWQIGEDISGALPLRNMSNPPAFNDPDRMTSPLYRTQSGDAPLRDAYDNGGVHTNSGIGNKAAFLMADGGSFNGQTVTGLGITKVEAIYYEVQTHLLTSGADYQDLYNALYQACNNLVGIAGIVVGDCQQVRNATLAVEMNLQPLPNFNLDAPVCAPGQSPSSIFFDDFEAGPSNFQMSAATGTNRWRFDTDAVTFNAHSGIRYLYADDAPPAVSDSFAAMAAAVTLPSNAFLHFAHAYGFENPNWDGGVVEYTINNGASWVDAGSLFDNVGYSGTVAVGAGNPLAGRAAFVGDSHGYVSSRLNLSSLAGQSVRFRWRMGLDPAVQGAANFDWGWWLDDVRIYTCGSIAPPGVPGTPSPSNSATGVATTSALTWSASGATSYDIAIGTVNPPAPVATGLTSASYSPTLAFGTTYYWQITARNANGTTLGPVWSFTTATLGTDVLAFDTFTGNNGTLLSAHAPDVNVSGSPWTVTGSTPAPTLNSGRVGVTAGTGHLQATLQTGAPDIRMGVDYRAGTASNQLAALAFRLTDANNHLLLMFYQNTLQFYRKQGGTYTLLATSAALAPIANGSTQRMEVRANGNQLTGWWNGVQVVQATDTFQQTATRHGLDWNSAFDPSTTFDNFEIRNAGAPLSPPGVPSNPNPGNTTVGVGTGVTLTWTATGATSYDIAFGTVSPPPSVATALGTASYTPTLTPNTTYYWQVTARNGVGSTTGPLWTFTTGALPADLLATDTFTGTNGTLLTAHAPDVNTGGGLWTVSGATGTPTLANGAAGITPGSGHVQATLQTGAPDVRLAADYRVGAGANQLAALAFRLTDGNNHFLLMFYANALHLYRKQAGAYTLLNSSAPLAPIASGSTQRMEVRANGSLLTGWWNGMQVVQSVDTFQQTATRHGLDWNAAFDTTAAFDNLEIRNLGAPLAPPGTPGTPTPANAATGVSTNAILMWSATSATSFDVAFGTVNPPPPVSTGQSGATYSPNLTNSTTYYWRITARNAGGATSGPVWSFTTAAPPPVPDVPASPSPANGATSVPTNTSLTWTAAGANRYDISFGTVNPPPPAATNLTSASYTPTTLPSTTYYWQIIARNSTGSTTGPLWSFTTAAAPSDLLVTDTFTAANGTFLSFRVPDIDVGGAPWIVTGGTGVPTLNNGVVGITPGAGHVQATINTGVASDVRVAADYRVGAGANQLAALAFRFTDENNHLLLMFFQNALHFYRRQAGAYTLLNSSGPLASIAAGSTQRIEVRTSGSQLTGWWNGVQVVQAVDTIQQNATRHGVDWNSGFDAAAAFDNFEIRNNGVSLAPPTVPTNPTPANSAVNVPRTAMLSWSSSGATTYDIAFGTVNPPPPTLNGLISPDYAPLMTANTTYYWRVTARSSGGMTVGPVWSFTTAPPPPAPDAPNTPSPANGATGAAINTPLTWSAANATSYDIAFGTVNPPPPAASNLSSASYAPTLAANTTYFWQVIARNATGTTTGPVWSFTTAALPADLLVTDAFTGASGTLLTAHAPDVNVGGGPWSVTGTGVPTLSGGVVGITPGSGHVQAVLQTGVSDVRVGADYRVGAGGNQLAALAFRFTDTNNHFLLMFYANALHLYRRQAGAYVLLTSSAPLAPVASGSTQRMEVRANGSQITGWWNGVQVVQAVDTFQQTATRHGLDWNAGFDTTAAFDNLEIRNLGAPITPPATPGSPMPSNGATGVATSATLTWSAAGATSYDVAFGTVNPPPPAASNLSSASYSPTTTSSTTYYWQVTARNSAGSATGPVWTFTTGSLPVDLLVTDTFAGANGTLLIAHPPDVNVGGGPWSVTGATGTPTLNNGVVGVTAGSGHVQATLQTNTADIRMAVDYRVGAGANQLAALAFRLTDGNNHLLLMFYQNALHFYRRQAGLYTLLASSGPLAPVVSGSTQRLEARTSGSQLTGLWNGVQVVQAVDTIQQTATRHGLDWNSAFDTAATFDNLDIRTNVGSVSPPAAPSNPSPANPSTDVPTNASLTWTATGATSYDVAFGTVNPPNVTIATNLTNPTYTPTLAAGTTYYWRVTARNSGGTTVGPVWSFTTAGASFVGRWQGETVQTWPISFVVGPSGITSLQVTVDCLPLSGPVIVIVNDPNISPPIPIANNSFSHFFTGTGGGADVTGTFSSSSAASGTVRAVVSACPAALPQAWTAIKLTTTPSLPSPGNGWLNVPVSTTLRWAADGVISYDVALGTTQTPPTVATGLVAPNYTPSLQPGTTYFWRVTSQTASGPVQGPLWTFSTQGLPGTPSSPNPASGATNVATSSALSWSSTGATSYDVAFGTVNPPSATVATNLTNPTYTPTLAAGTTYFWRVTARNNAGTTVGPVWSFTTAGAASFAGSWRGVSSQGFAIAFTVAANTVTSMSAAETCFAAGGGTATVNVDAPSTSIPISNNSFHEVFSSGANGLDITGTFSSSDAASGNMFAINVCPGDPPKSWNATKLTNVPSWPSPVDGRVNLPVNTTLFWYAVGATSYDVALGTTMTPPTVATGVINGSYSPTLQPGTTYFWRITSQTASGPVQGPLWSFSTQALPSAAGTPSPASAATNVPTTTPFTWTATGASSYDIAIGTVSPPPTVATNLTSQAYTPSTPLAGSTTYFWRVTTRNGGGSVPGPIWSFTTGALPTVPSSPSPVSGAPSVPPSTVLSWSSTGATTYDIVMNTFNPPLSTVASGLTSASYAPLLIVGNTYYWRVIARNAMGAVTGPVWSFTVGALPSTPSNPTPANLATNVSLTPTLSWFSGGPGTTYDVAFGIVNPPSSPVTTDLTIPNYIPPSLTASTTYFWQVTARNATGTSVGPVWSFTTLPAPPSIPTSPNPANGATGVATNAVLTWSAPGATGYDIWFSTTSPPILQGSVPIASFAPVMLPNTTYFWRVTARNAAGSVLGPIWSFTTGASGASPATEPTSSPPRSSPP